MERGPQTYVFIVVATVLFFPVFFLYTPPVRYYYSKLAGLGPSQKTEIVEPEYTESDVERYDSGHTENMKTLDLAYTEVNIPDTWKGNRFWLDDLSRDNLTIVTAYWDLGSFKKGPSHTFTRETYLNWFRTFAFMTNPLVVFTDSQMFINLTRKHRAHFRRKTRIFLVQRNVLWPFELINQIRSVFSQPGYPKHYPNTVIPEYSAAQHAKYVVLAQTARRRYFNTPYFAWLDIGYFRDIVESKYYFTLYPPADFDSSKIAFNRVFNLKMTESPIAIFNSNKVWVGGGLVIGVPRLILNFEALYHKAVLYFLEKKLMSTDQQIIFSMYSKDGRKDLKPTVGLQIYIPQGNVNPWFYLGYLCMERV